MEGLAATCRRSAHALNEPLAALLLLPDRDERAAHLQRATLGCEHGLRIRASLLDRAPLRNCRCELHSMSEHRVAGERFQERLDSSATNDG